MAAFFGNIRATTGMGSCVDAEGWRRVPVRHVEELADGILGAGLKATQMSRGPFAASLVFAVRDGITYSGGYLAGRVALAGPLSQNQVTVGVGLTMGPGTRHWLNEVRTGAVGVFMPGDEHDALYTPGSLYAAATLDATRLELEAARRGVVLNAKMLGGTGISEGVGGRALDALRERWARLHAGDTCCSRFEAAPADELLDLLIAYFARVPACSGSTSPGGLGRIVARARAFIEDNLEAPLSIDTIAEASCASRRTLFRAFHSVLGEAPSAYVRRRRLHRIRHDLASAEECVCTVALVANRWGLPEFGRMAGWYRDLFGERPSETLTHRPSSTPAGVPDRLARSA